MLLDKDLITKDIIESSPNFINENYPDLFNAIKEESLIVFIGAGVSRLIGCLGWTELGISLVKRCRKNDIFNYEEEDILIKEANINPRKVISICFNKCSMDNNHLEKIYYRTIKDAIKIKNHDKLEIYRLVLELKAKSYITTNIDKGIINQFNPEATGQKIYDCTLDSFEHVADEKIVKDRNIFYLHGRGEDDRIKQTIFSVDRYLDFYKKNHIRKFLKGDIFNGKNTILFIGYGLNEWEILEHLFRSSNRDNNTEKLKELPMRYILVPIYSSEYIKCKLDESYYNFFDVNVIPYFIDCEGYDKLFDVLKRLNKASYNYQPKTSEVFNKIDEVLNDSIE